MIDKIAAETSLAARESVDAGSAALGRGDKIAAVRWFRRAHRLAPNDPTAMHLLASALAANDAVSALEVIDALLQLVPHNRDALVSRVVLLYRIGEAESAASALDQLLGSFAVPRGNAFSILAGDVAARAGCAGWVGVTGQGVAVSRAARIEFRVDSARPFLTAAGAGEHALPTAWRRAQRLHAASPDGRLLGAVIDLAAIRHIEGAVAFDRRRGLHGWARAPFDPDTIPTIDLVAGKARKPFASVQADDDSFRPEHGEEISNARAFSVQLADLPPTGMLHVRARGSGTLAGSPIHIDSKSSVSSQATRGPARRRDIDIVIPLYRGAAFAQACVASCAACAAEQNARACRIVAIDDGSPEPELVAWAERAAAAGEICLLRHQENRGFPAAVNTGLRHAGARDVLILNSDTLLPPCAISRLADAAYAASDIGTVTPMTNDGGITTVAVPGRADKMPQASELLALDAALQAANPGVRVEIPTCVGFCTYIRHDCLAQTGLLREDAFAQGYGEENDFSRRASRLGWRHLAACDVMVGHQGGVSFGPVRRSLMARNLAILERLHPGYGDLVTDFVTRDPLRAARAAFDARRWEAGRRDGAVVLVTHDSGGGLERHVAARAAAIGARGLRAIVVRPRDGFALSDGVARDFPNLVFGSADALADFLRGDRPQAVELHHIAAHAPGIERLAGKLRVPFDIIVHDYAAICPRVTLCVGGTYCGEPADVRDCDDCIADHGAQMPFDGGVQELRQGQATLFGAARQVVVPTADTGARLRRYMKRIRPVVRPWEDDLDWPAARVGRGGGDFRVAVVGAIGVEKGFDVLLACARDAARRQLKLQFTVVGHTIDDKRLMQTGRVFVTGPFVEGEAASLLRESEAALGFLPSVWPETWCYALSALWEAGLHVMAFDLGAQAERIRARGGGTIVAAGLAAGALNDRMMGLREMAGG